MESIRKNIMVHGSSGSGESGNLVNLGKEESKSRRGGRRKDKGLGESASGSESREAALNEREMAAKEVERLRHIVRRQRKDLRARMLEISREEAERKRMLDERANYRFVGLQAFYAKVVCLLLSWLMLCFLLFSLKMVLLIMFG